MLSRRQVGTFCISLNKLIFLVTFMKNFASKFLFASSLWASVLFIISPCHCTDDRGSAEEEFSPRTTSHSWSSSAEDPTPLKSILSSTPSASPSNHTSILQLEHAPVLRLDLSATRNTEDTEKEKDQHTRKLSSRLIMPHSKTKITQTAEEDEDDLFDDMADEIEAALTRLAISNKQRKQDCEEFPCEKELKPLPHTLDASFPLPLSSSPLETEIVTTPLHRELFQASDNKLTMMIETAKDEQKPLDTRITYGRQAVMFLMTDNSFSRTFKGDKDVEIYGLIVLLSTLHDPYATFRLAEYQFKSDSQEGSSTQKLSTNVEKANGTFTQALNLLLEHYDSEKDNVYLFNSMRTILTEAAIFNASLDMGFYPLLKLFLEKPELGESSTKSELAVELKKVLTFCESKFKSSQENSS